MSVDTINYLFAKCARTAVLLDEATAMIDELRGERNSAREALAEVMKLTVVLRDALETLYHKTIVGTDDERHAALDAAWAAIQMADGEA